jgi:hypothetical protein
MRRVLTQTDAPVNSGRRVAFSGEMTAAIAAGLLGSVALFPLVALQGTATRRRIPCLPPVKPPHHGLVPGRGSTIRVLAIGDRPWRASCAAPLPGNSAGDGEHPGTTAQHLLGVIIAREDRTNRAATRAALEPKSG